MFEFECIVLKPCLLQPCFHVAGALAQKKHVCFADTGMYTWLMYTISYVCISIYLSIYLSIYIYLSLSLSLSLYIYTQSIRCISTCIDQCCTGTRKVPTESRRYQNPGVWNHGFVKHDCDRNMCTAQDFVQEKYEYEVRLSTL